MADGILNCFTLHLSMYFRIGSRISVTFKIKFYVRTVNKFSTEFHVKHGIKPELNIVA